MLFLDSWIWIEFFLEEEKRSEKAKAILQQAEKEGGMISALVLTEVRYRIGKKFGMTRADEAIYLMENFPKLRIIPVVPSIAKLAAELRIKYYSKERQVSFADMIYLATAFLGGCSVLCSGDPDFNEVEEVEVRII